ncbi:glycosyltransferase family 9 protein [Actinosynnema mirum]|uniref:Glycosyl transferase family 9 n=1 Tax=Actinosynnema mirum (strain ATCC 29888 / DSM 43827 / JCM 3225 / NBRC 14064 / NCIMB 13271 / NRRL B-12336 / IMRU 3971 / 101) TaxID=446462 RepID=C6WBY8_ACTMD|nr:glycosyltransferase family 9 protein [Actinosynnema mirum]ACU37555.1 glycosyl transferase family 9 [Actinosynnema mirum DSM 43827]
MTLVSEVHVFARLVAPGLGDLVQRNIGLALLRRAYPEARITVVTGRGVATRFAEFFERHSHAAAVLPCPDPGEADADDRARFLDDLAGLGAQVCFVDPDSRGLGAKEARRAGIPVRYGLPGPDVGEGDLTHPLRLPSPLFGGADLFDHATALAKALGLPGRLRAHEVVPAFPRSATPPRALVAGSPGVAFHPGGAPQWNRRWPLDKYAELCLLVARRTGATCYLLGGQAERPDLLRLAAAVTASQPRARVEVVAGGSLDEAANLLAEVDLLVGNDSSLAHVAAAVGTPTVVVYGPTGTEFLWARVYQGHTGVSLRYPCQSVTNPADDLSGRTCAHHCSTPYTSPDGTYPKCLSDLTVERVWDVVARRLGEPRERRIEVLP